MFGTNSWIMHITWKLIPES